MIPEQRVAFLEARAQGLGGSDAASLLQHIIPDMKYSCRRRLFYDKSKHKKDFEREETGPMKLGNLLEPVLCQEFSKLTGRRIEVVGQQKHSDFPEMVGHVDRMQHTPERETPGILECKALGTRIFYQTKRSGLAPEYLLQLQWYLCVAGASWGSYIIGNRDNLALIHFDVERDDKIHEAFLREAPAFWASLSDPKNIPERLEPDSFACQSCEYRITCQANALLPSSDNDDIPIADELMPLVQEYLERREEFDRAEGNLAETKEIVATILGDRSAVQVHVGDRLRPIYFRQQPGKPLYAQCVKDMSVQYDTMREQLIKIAAVAPEIAPLAELIPPPASFLRKGKPSRPLMLQFLSPKVKEEE